LHFARLFVLLRRKTTYKRAFVLILYVMKRQKYILLLLFLMAASLQVAAQGLVVKNFYHAERDFTANSGRNLIKDQNDEPCALIKVRTMQKGLTFDAGRLFPIEKTEEQGGDHPLDIYVWVQNGAKRFSIGHPQLGVLSEYDLQTTLLPGQTYILELVTGEVQTIVKQARTTQYVVFQLTPPEAVVELNGEMLATSGGTAQKLMPFGSYQYTVKAPNYQMEVGRIKVDDPKNKHIVTVSLKPNFAAITLTAPSGAEIWVDEERKGTGSWTGNLGAGAHIFEARLAGHRPSQRNYDLVVANGPQTITLEAPTPIVGEAEITSDPALADIYIDGKKVGQTPQLISDLLVGSHSVKLSRKGYADYTATLSVKEGETASLTASMKKQETPITTTVKKKDSPAIAGGGSVTAQGTSIKVTSFEANEMDMSHYTTRQKEDNNGNVCALIVVHTSSNASGFTFSAGLDFCETDGPELSDGENLYFVHIAKGTKKMTIRNDKYGKPLEVDFHTKLKEKTYDMYIKTGEVIVINNNFAEKQWVIIDVTPLSAVPLTLVEISTETVDKDPNQQTLTAVALNANGHLEKQMKVGTYWIKVTAGNEYGEYNGKLVVKGDEVLKLPINLVPHYGWLKLEGASAAENVTVYIDRKVQRLKNGTIQLASGQHEIRIIRPLYKQWTANITISDGETLTYNPSLEANFPETTFTVPNDPEAEIYIDGRLEGKGTCKRPLEPGSYTVETRKDNHHKQSKVVQITTTKKAEVFELDAPVPIMGTLIITSSPSGASIKLDGKDIGRTPISINRILVGKHIVQLSAPNCKTEARQVTVRQGEQTDLNVNLSSVGTFTFNTNTGYGILYINGKYMGNIPYTWEAPSGYYDIEVSAYGYKKFHEKNYLLNINKPDVMIRLKR